MNDCLCITDIHFVFVFLVSFTFPYFTYTRIRRCRLLQLALVMFILESTRALESCCVYSSSDRSADAAVRRVVAVISILGTADVRRV